MTEVRETARRGGQGNCAVCHSPDQDAINEQLVRGVALNRLEKRLGISRRALRNHKLNHITPALVALRQERIADGVRKVSDRIEDLIGLADSILTAARAGGNPFMALKAIREQRANFELLARVTGELDERAQVTVNLQSTQEWIRIQTVVVKFVTERLSEKDAAELSRRLKVLDGGRT
ncbi:MAG TPA: hypothetical protein VN973_05995 [Candidatus Dormibacteraeota bacterium]|nr:hypothetical protein [Candidatus Dormibacteraeota bacterium]